MLRTDQICFHFSQDSWKTWIMNLFAAIFSLVSAQGGCNWIWGESGNRLECLPDFYIDGICESGRRNDCGWVKLGTGASFNCIFKRSWHERVVRNPLLPRQSRDSDRPSLKLRLAKRRNRRGRFMSTKRRRPDTSGARALLDFGAERRQRRLSRRRRPFCLLLRRGNQRRRRLLRLAVWNVRQESVVPDQSRRDRILRSQQHWRLSTRHQICRN